MSWHYSRALVAASSAGICSDGIVSAQSSTTATPEAYSWQDKTTGVCRRSRSGMMSEPLTDALGEAVLMWCLADSLAKTSQRQERERESPESDQGSGVRWRALSVKFDPVSCGWKTAHCLCEEDLDWSSMTLPRWGSLHDGELWERDTPALLTEETGFGCWVGTPTAAMSIRSPRFRRTTLPTPAEFVAAWPTPMAQDAKHSGWAPSGPGNQDKLPYAVMRSIYPTPQASDCQPRQKSERWKGDDLVSRVTEIERKSGTPIPATGGRLNPTWVEWLMGWPLGWTDCAASATDRFRKWCESHGTS